VLRWSAAELELDGKLDDALFHLSAPPGARTVEEDAAPPGKS
jgi:hypothetical protein